MIAARFSFSVSYAVNSAVANVYAVESGRAFGRVKIKT